MRRLIEVIKKKIGKEEKLTPIVDVDLYVDLYSSSCGGTLKEKKIVFITDTNVWNQAIIQKCNVEKINYTIIELSQEYESEDIELWKKHFETADIVINMLHDKANLFKDDGSYNCNDSIRILYRIMQNESEYFINNAMKPIICNVVHLVGNNIETGVIEAGIKSMLHGLGYILPNHGIVSNALVVKNDVDIEEVLKMTIFLVSKYGYALTGEVIEMS